MLARAVGPNLTKLLHDQLDLIFKSQLTEPLRLALEAIARHIPPLLRTIQDKLLDLISVILSGQKYKPLGAPAQYARPDITNVKDYTVQVCFRCFFDSQPSIKSMQSNTVHSSDTIRLALYTLGTFDFSGAPIPFMGKVD